MKSIVVAALLVCSMACAPSFRDRVIAFPEGQSGWPRSLSIDEKFAFFKGWIQWVMRVSVVEEDLSEAPIDERDPLLGTRPLRGRLVRNEMTGFPVRIRLEQSLPPLMKFAALAHEAAHGLEMPSLRRSEILEEAWATCVAVQVAARWGVDVEPVLVPYGAQFKGEIVEVETAHAAEIEWAVTVLSGRGR